MAHQAFLLAPPLEICCSVGIVNASTFPPKILKISALWMMIGMITAIRGFSQESTSLESAMAKHNTPLPAKRTLTASDGRALAGTILAIGDGSITFRRNSDGKKFDIPVADLSKADQNYILNWEPLPSYRPSSVSLRPNPLLTRSAYPSTYQPRYSSGMSGGGTRSVVTRRSSCQPTGGAAIPAGGNAAPAGGRSCRIVRTVVTRIEGGGCQPSSQPSAPCRSGAAPTSAPSRCP
jgi:hypothetical protein